MTDELLLIETVVLLVLAPVSLLSARYLRRIYLRSPAPRLLLFRSLVTSDLTTALGGTYFAYVIVARLLELSEATVKLPVFRPPWSTLIGGAVVIVLLLPPTVHATSVYLVRRKARLARRP